MSSFFHVCVCLGAQFRNVEGLTGVRRSEEQASARPSGWCCAEFTRACRRACQFCFEISKNARARPGFSPVGSVVLARRDLRIRDVGNGVYRLAPRPEQRRLVGDRFHWRFAARGDAIENSRCTASAGIRPLPLRQRPRGSFCTRANYAMAV